MYSTQIFGRVSRAYYLLAGMVLATVALVLVMAFADAKPAQAAGEDWYGTVDWTKKGTKTYEDGTIRTENSRVYFEAPVSATQARISMDWHLKSTYPKPSWGGCYVASEDQRLRGSDTDAEIKVSESTWDGISYLDVWSHDYYTGVPTSTTTTKEYAGTNPDGTSCARTETTVSQGHWYASASFNARKNEGTTSRKCDGSALSIPCRSTHNFGFLSESTTDAATTTGTTTVRWSLTKNVCSGYSKSWNIGKDDTLVLFNPCQAESLNARMSVFDDIPGTPKVCGYSFSKAGDDVGTKLARRLNKLCDGYKAVLRLQWFQVRWFAYNAALWDACAVWVVDDASWRPPKIKPATRDSDGLAVSWIKPGRTETIKTANGPFTVTC